MDTIGPRYLRGCYSHGVRGRKGDENGGIPEGNSCPTPSARRVTTRVDLPRPLGVEGRVRGSTSPRGGIRQPYERSRPRTSSAPTASFPRQLPNNLSQWFPLHFRLAQRWCLRHGQKGSARGVVFSSGWIHAWASSACTAWVSCRTGWNMDALPLPSSHTVGLLPSNPPARSTDGHPKGKACQREDYVEGGVFSHVNHITWMFHDVGVRRLDRKKRCRITMQGKQPRRISHENWMP